MWLLWLIVGLVISIILLVIQTKKTTSIKNAHATSIDALLGQKGLVTQTIGEPDNEVGLVRLDGEIWSALSLKGTRIEKGVIVKVHDIKGVRLIVTPLTD